MPSTHIVIQQIDTEWTKASRGGEGACRRNAVPTELTLPLDCFAAPVAMHVVDSFEWNDFQLDDSVKHWNSICDVRIPFLKLETRQNNLRIRFVRSPQNWVIANRLYDGVDGKPVLDVDAFVLGCDEWGRVRFNARYTSRDTGEWYYQHVVCNIGVFSSVELNRFVTLKPNHQFVELATLA